MAHTKAPQPCGVPIDPLARSTRPRGPQPSPHGPCGSRPRRKLASGAEDCLSDAGESELLTILTERVEAMPYGDVSLYWNALSTADRDALTEALSDLEME